MLPEVKSIENELKQILYGCVEHIQATKAALYLSASHDLNEKTFELVTSYQFKVADRQVVTANDDLIDRLAVKRAGFYVNGLGSDATVAEVLFRQDNDRLLITPLLSRGRLVGFIDMRDKAAKKPFENPDLGAAKRIADEVLAVLAKNKLFGISPIQVVDDVASAAPPEAAPATPPPQARVALRDDGFSIETKRAIAGAREFLSRRQLARTSGRRSTTDREIEILQLLLPGTLALPGAVLAALSAAGQNDNPRLAVARAELQADLLSALQRHVHGVLQRASQPQVVAPPRISYPFGTRAVPMTVRSISAVVSVPVVPQSLDGAILTVAFENTAAADAQKFVAEFLRQVEQSVETAIASSGGGGDRQTLAEKLLLEPDFQKYPELVEHCRSVSVLAHRFASAIGLPATQVETVRLAALVHDAGLRLIEYDRLYTQPRVTPEEKRVMAEHPLVGAALVEPLLGADVAQAVLRHHERVDGSGYPSRLRGHQIPIASKVIQIADAWVAMTEQQPYQPAIPRSMAAERLREGAGTQFDAALVDAFLKVLPRISG